MRVIKQDWLHDSLEMLRDLTGNAALELPSLSKMTSDDLSNLHDALYAIQQRYAPDDD